MELARKLSRRLHGQATRADDRFFLALVDLAPHHLQHLVGDEAFAGSAVSRIGAEKAKRTATRVYYEDPIE